MNQGETMTPFIQGFGTGGGLIAAIGAQNAFVLTQGVRKNHHMLTALICIACDTVFISIGIAGFGSLIATKPILARMAAWGGAIFLLYYGFESLRSALKGGALTTGNNTLPTRKAAALATLAVTLLNPHFYLDTVVLLGGVSTQFSGDHRLYFWGGAVTASVAWFICLSLGGRLLAPLFTHSLSWRILDSLVCLTMWSIALSLVVDSITLQPGI